MAKQPPPSNTLPPRNPRRVACDQFLREDPEADIADYVNEVRISPTIPYVEIINWCETIIRNETPEIDVNILPGIFALGGWGEIDGNNVRVAAFEALLRDKPQIFNGPAVRIENCAAIDQKLRLDVQRAKYFDQCRSNLILDYAHHKESGSIVTLRNLLRHEFGQALPPIQDRRMANTLGVAALILVRSIDDIALYLVSRTRDVMVFDRGGEWHCTASGAAEMRGEKIDNGRFYRDSMLRELDEEVGLLEHDLEMLEPVAFCREMKRGGKPQMFFIGVTRLDQASLRNKLRGARRRVRETGGVMENTTSLLIAPSNLGAGNATTRVYDGKGFTIETAVCLHYYLKCQSIAGGGWPGRAW